MVRREFQQSFSNRLVRSQSTLVTDCGLAYGAPLCRHVIGGEILASLGLHSAPTNLKQNQTNSRSRTLNSNDNYIQDGKLDPILLRRDIATASKSMILYEIDPEKSQQRLSPRRQPPTKTSTTDQNFQHFTNDGHTYDGQ